MSLLARLTWIQGSVVAISNGIGPVIGGALAQTSHDGWRWIYRLNLPLSALALLCTIFFMPLKKVTGDWRLYVAWRSRSIPDIQFADRGSKFKATDFLGMLLSLGGASVFLLGLTWGGADYAWDSAHVVTALTVGLSFLGSFVAWQWKGARIPLVPRKW